MRNIGKSLGSEKFQGWKQEIGRRVRLLRVTSRPRLTGQDLAKNYLNVETNFLSAIERGNSSLPIAKALILSHSFNVSIESIYAIDWLQSRAPEEAEELSLNLREYVLKNSTEQSNHPTIEVHSLDAHSPKIDLETTDVAYINTRPWQGDPKSSVKPQRQIPDFKIIQSLRKALREIQKILHKDDVRRWRKETGRRLRFLRDTANPPIPSRIVDERVLGNQGIRWVETGVRTLQPINAIVLSIYFQSPIEWIYAIDWLETNMPESAVVLRKALPLRPPNQ